MTRGHGTLLTVSNEYVPETIVRMLNTPTRFEQRRRCLKIVFASVVLFRKPVDRYSRGPLGVLANGRTKNVSTYFLPTNVNETAPSIFEKGRR